jgi:plastocyanin
MGAPMRALALRVSPGRACLVFATAVGLLLSSFVALAATQNVAIQGSSPSNFAFAPNAVTVTSGDTVHWANGSSAPHTATRCDSTNCPVGAGTGTAPATFDSGTLGGGSGVFDQVFTGAGTYNFYCTIHGYAIMHGTVTVNAAAVAAPTTTATPAQGAAAGTPRIPRAGVGGQSTGKPAGISNAGMLAAGLVLFLLVSSAVLVLTFRRPLAALRGHPSSGRRGR